MTDQQQESLRKAREIVTRQTGLTECACDTPASHCGWCRYSQLIPAISAALTSARQVPEGHVRGSDGVDREIVQEANGKIAGVQHRVVWVRIEAAQAAQRSKSE